MVRSLRTVDPAGDAASLLRRIGFLVLMIGLPFGAFASRTTPVFVFAIGIAVMSAASVFGGVSRSLRTSVAGLSVSPTVWAVAIVAGWTLLSVSWSAAPRFGGSAASGLLAVLGVGAIGFFALPDRMRAANLYPMPIGVGLASLVGLGLAFAGRESGYADSTRMERGLTVLVTLAWPGVAWLRSRGRDVEAVTLAIVAAGAAAFGASPVPIVAFAAGTVAYLVAQLFGRRGAVGVATALAGLVLVAPILLWLPPPESWRIGSLAGWWTDLDTWRRAMFAEPVRVVTGHGIGAARTALAGTGLPATFASSLLGLWYDLGIVGAVGVAVATWAVLREAGPDVGPLLPGFAATLLTVTILGLAGLDGGALWWPVTLATVALMFVAAGRSQFRTRRPRALALGGRRPA